MSVYINHLLFGLYPYLVMGIFITGCVMRYRGHQETWHVNSTQLVSGGIYYRIAINAFHLSIIFLFFSHLLGLLTAHSVYSHFFSASTKQLLAMIVGGTVGMICFFSMTFILIRRFTDRRVAPYKSTVDNTMFILIYMELIVGLLTIPKSAESPRGESMIALANWAQHIMTFRTDAFNFVIDQNIIFKIHLFLGLTITLLVPFTPIVHMFSFPLKYLFRKNRQIVRKRG